MRSLADDPNSRQNLLLSYQLINRLVQRHHINDRLHLLGYINKAKGYYTVYLTQDPASPRVSSFGYFNISLGNFRSSTDKEVYYYYNEFRNGSTEDEILAKIEGMIEWPKYSTSPADGDYPENAYTICVNVINAIVQLMKEHESGFAIENEICPYIGPYSKVPDNNLWHELIQTVGEEHDLRERCTYDYFAVGSGVPTGPVYRAWGFVANDGYVYIPKKDRINIIELHEQGNSLYRDC